MQQSIFIQSFFPAETPHMQRSTSFQRNGHACMSTAAPQRGKEQRTYLHSHCLPQCHNIHASLPSHHRHASVHSLQTKQGREQSRANRIAGSSCRSDHCADHTENMHLVCLFLGHAHLHFCKHVAYRPHCVEVPVSKDMNPALIKRSRCPLCVSSPRMGSSV